MPETFNFSLGDMKIKPPRQSGLWPWKIAVAALTVAVIVLGFMLYQAAWKVSGPQHSVPELGKDTEVAVLTHKANDFISRYLSFSATLLDEHKKSMIKLMTRDYANSFEITWSDPTLTAAIKRREVRVSVTTDSPAIKSVDEQGRIFVNVSGKIKVQSDKTYIRSQERYFSGTVVLVKTEEGYKVANVIWRNAQ